MSTVQINPTQKSRLYKIDVYGLQDNYLGTLQSYGDSFIGQIIDPELSISDDGTSSFSCSIPKFYIDPATNLRVTNPRWGDIDKGVLAENTRILKVFIQFDNETKVFPFIIDSITDKRDNNFSVYRQITASGLAFAELGKIGYKIELSEAVIDNDRELFGYEPILNINYWLDKIFPNEKDESGNITKWLTPWSYEIKMDWQGYPKEDRANDKIYDDAKVASWKLKEDNSDILPDSYEPSKERQRIVEAANSNKYNITQSIAEAFEVFCVYEYKCDTRGRFIKSYTDELNHPYTGRKVVFYNRAIKSHNPLQITYQKNLDSISRTSDTTELYTKLYVPAVDDAVMDNGQISIDNTPMNPIQDDFILNFDYLYNIGSITETQWNFVKKYKVDLRNLNQDLREKQKQVSKLQIQLNKLKAKITTVTNERDQARERVTEAEQTLQALPQSEPIERTIDRPVPVTFFEDPENATLCRGKFNLQGIIPSTVKGYQPVPDSETDQDPPIPDDAIKEKDSNGKEYWQRISKFVQTPKISNKIGEGFYGILDDAGYLTYIVVSRSQFETTKVETNGDDYEEVNPDAAAKPKKLVNTLVYFTLTYNEATYYEDIIEIFSRIRDNKEVELELLIEQETALNAEITNYTKGFYTEDDVKVDGINDLLLAKENLNQDFERKMGSALREGYWTPENTGGVYENIEEEVQVEFLEPDPDTEEIGYTYASLEDRTKDKRTYYSYIELPKDLWGNIENDQDNTENNYLKDLTFILKSKSERKLTFQESATPVDDDDNEEPIYSSKLAAGYYSIKPYATSQLFYFYLKSTISKSGTLILEDKENLSLTFKLDNSEQSISFISKGNSIPKDGKGNPVTILKDLTNYLPNLAIPLILQNNSGYVFAYRKYQETGNGETIIKYQPIAILNNDKLQYSQYTSVGYNYSGDLDTNKIYYNEKLKIVPSSVDREDKNGNIIRASTALETRYPRIILSKPNINSDSTTTFKIFSESTELTRYEEYSVVKDIEEEQTRISLKISENNTFTTFADGYTIQYQVSHADDYLYQDSYEVALENSKPRFSYEVSISNLPHNSQIVELGQLAHINDYLLGANRMRGYVSSITYKLNEPQSDSLTLQNYKTKFEDLFSTITASSEAMKTNQRSYNAAASSFDSKGNINGDILQSSIDANEIALNFSNTSVTIDDNDGILLTNKTAYSNGVYGQVAIRGGGIFMSDSVDQTSGLRYWNTGITPHGINASLITSGQLDTNVIRIFAGSDMAFQWNAEGLNAYRRTDSGFDSNSYIRYSGEGLHYRLNDVDVLSLDWDNGLLINAEEGSTQLDGKLGLVVYDGNKNEAGNNWLVRIGRFKESEEKPTDQNLNPPKVAGMRLYEKIGNEYICSLDATNNGQLWLKRTLTLGGNTINQATAGISGLDSYSFWAGKNDSNIANSSFYVTKDGYLKATNATIKGSVTATSGAIGSWILDGDYLAYKDNSNNKIVGLHSGSSADNNWIKDDPIRIFAGGTDSSNRNFYVTQNGRLLATQAHFGNKANYIELKTEEDCSLIQSSNYSPDFAGWKIDSKGYAEFENVKVRGELTTVVFKREEVSAIGGQLFLSPSWMFDEAEIIQDSDSNHNILEIPMNSSQVQLFQKDQKVGVTCYQKITDINIEKLSFNAIYSDYSTENKAKFLITKINSGTLIKGPILNITVIVLGTQENEQYILLDAQNNQGPFIDIIQNNASNAMPRVRLGNLNGLREIANSSDGHSFGNFVNIEGYGLYSENAYLTGQVALPNAGITNQVTIGYSHTFNTKDNDINKLYYKCNSDENTKGDAIRFWAGGGKPEEGNQVAPFIVTQNGTLYASKAILSGELQTAGIIVDSDETIAKALHKRFYVAREYKNNEPTVEDYILNIDENGLSIFNGKIAAYSESKDPFYSYKFTDEKEKNFNVVNTLPFFYTIDDYDDTNCNSRWVAKSGHIFTIQKKKIDENTFQDEATSIVLNDGIHFYKEITTEPITISYEKELYKKIPTASFSLLSGTDCLNYSGTKFGFGMTEEDNLNATVNIRGSLGFKDMQQGNKGGIIISPAIDDGIICGLDIISLY